MNAVVSMYREAKRTLITKSVVMSKPKVLGLRWDKDKVQRGRAKQL